MSSKSSNTPENICPVNWKLLDKYSTNKKKWIDQISYEAYHGDFLAAKKLIEYGIDFKKYNLTKNDANIILASCGIDLRYWFVEFLIYKGGKIPKKHMEMLKEIKNTKSINKKSTLYYDLIKTVESFNKKNYLH